MQNIILFGNGQVAQHVYQHFAHDERYRVAAFTVDRAYLTEPELLGLPVVPFEEVAERFPPAEFGMHVSISFRQVNRLRAEKFEQARAKGYSLVSYISPRAVVAPGVTLGENCLVGNQVILDPYVALGDDVHIAAGCIVGHHSRLGDHCFLGPGVIVAGSVTVEPYCFLGAGSVIRDRLVVRQASVVGAGSVILEDTRPKGVYLARQAECLPLSSDELPVG